MKFPTFALLLVSLGLTRQLHGQGQAAVPVYLGVSGGSGIRGEVLFRGSVPAEIVLKDNFSALVEIGYVERENPSVLAQLHRGRNYLKPVISYLELPVLAKVRLSFESFDLFFVGGPQIAYGIALRSTYEEDNMLRSEKLTFEETGLSRLDLGLVAGGGLEKEISEGRKIFIDMRFYLGLFNINKEGDEAIFNQGKHFSLGFLIPIKKKRPE